MSIKRLALCRSQGRLFVLLRFVGQDIAGLIEQEGPQAFAHATTNDVSVPGAGAVGRSWSYTGALSLRCRL